MKISWANCAMFHCSKPIELKGTVPQMIGHLLVAMQRSSSSLICFKFKEFEIVGAGFKVSFRSQAGL